ncbi:MAG TPA: ABC-F family ATP-binding cassette domain-containing protein, partial [Fimbriimonas sp.]|nr:ABC-F family ATP-binding cassette domain-containing protein [Fimbriimonas sp.]
MLLSVSNVKKAFGPDEILHGVTLRLERKERVALVGRNGAGKSTLLKILTGQYPPDSGSVQFAQGAKVGYLKQEQPVTFGRTVLEEAQAATEEKLRLQVRLRELEDLLANNESDPDILEEYTLVHEHFLDSEGYSVETDVRTVLLKMGFEESEFNKITDSLSGGEKTRLAIARLLLEEPDLLILDEPTNHLDLQATEWLENWIRGYHGAILLVSHDRTFLENTAQRVIHMADGMVKSYPGTFEKYRQLRAEEEARLAEVAKRQDQEIARMDEYVRRFMNSQRTAQARGRLKMKDKLIQSKVSAPKSDRQMAGGFGAAARSGDLVVQTKKLDVGFDDGTLINGLDWTVQMGERWGIVGENGAGKSTLIKTCMGEHTVLSGEAKLGSGVVAGYFTQDASDLDPELSSLDTLCMVDGMTPPEARTLLGRFLISGEDVYRPIRTLSGGEKNKLSLARLTHVRPNLLVLDEPTNHLDMASRDAL